MKKILKKILRDTLNRDFRRRIRKIKDIRAVPRTHYAHYSVEDEFNYNLVTVQQNNLISFTVENTRDLELESVLEIGCTSDLFLKEVRAGKKIGLNVLDACCEQIQRQGIYSIKAKADSIPLQDKSVDVVICYETLEHVHDPINVLRELERISRRFILLSIPWVLRTNIRAKYHGAKPGGRPISEYHIFEFSEEDFRKILSHTNLKVEGYKKLLNYKHFQSFLLYKALEKLYLGSFPALQAYILKSSEVWTEDE